MNIYDVFPEDIWILIIVQLPYPILSKLYDVSEQFYELCKRKSLDEKCKMRGFPRKEGVCVIHDVSDYSGSICNYNNELIYQGRFRKLVINSDYYDNYEQNIEFLLSATLDLMCSRPIDLLRGDLINFKCDDGIFLYNGSKIIHYTDLVPDEFDIIINKIPRNYWKDHIYYIFTFYHKNILKELTENVKLQNSIVFTHFCIENEYYIIALPGPYGIYSFKNILHKKDNLELEVAIDLDKYSFTINDKKIENIYIYVNIFENFHKSSIKSLIGIICLLYKSSK